MVAIGMDSNQYSHRERLETLWYFQRERIVRFAAIDALAIIALTWMLWNAKIYLPVIAFPVLASLNFALSTRNVRELQVELPLAISIAGAWSTLIAMYNYCVLKPAPRAYAQQAMLDQSLATGFFVVLAMITLSAVFALYTLWSSAEMESQVRQAKLDRD